MGKKGGGERQGASLKEWGAEGPGGGPGDGSQKVYIVLAKKFAQGFLYHRMKRSERIFWPTQYFNQKGPRGIPPVRAGTAALLTQAWAGGLEAGQWAEDQAQ